ncbi:hypothetical protein [Polyangium jinanense]|uniref:Uncharacterized protein n=1 Tax=Polyangium jinanense TaxID=2829994 RepID=A0A9X4AYR5_9BACT|nr:hypothetical protein [Polyangium jinanense]MDC3957768.1 hypothetical protein [Polyangium jinanense]MDC3961962.1 hypothetical protein [Polyangium jinanense]MDC3987560.1 hypothetical protein [Polyangium jinanense]
MTAEARWQGSGATKTLELGPHGRELDLGAVGAGALLIGAPWATARGSREV